MSFVRACNETVITIPYHYYNELRMLNSLASVVICNIDATIAGELNAVLFDFARITVF